mmetsp:Transcript_15442/g.17674  ORF Transcript_15442/g.17674 Transcript_15442/m.17674 type:complete len:80 (+) Transcript_15442:538-777(+)
MEDRLMDLPFWSRRVKSGAASPTAKFKTDDEDDDDIEEAVGAKAVANGDANTIAAAADTIVVDMNFMICILNWFEIAFE